MSVSVTVVIPAYNASGIIQIALRSLLAQEGAIGRLEVIVVDDASTDDTVGQVEAMIPEAESRGVALRVLRQAQNQGPAAARNRGAAAARGEVLLFTDADCEPLPTWVFEMLAPLADPGAAAVKGAYLTRQRQVAARFAQAEFEDRYRLLAKSREVDVVFSYSAAIRASVFHQVGGFDTGFPVADNEDTDLSYKISAGGHKIIFNPDAKIYHRHPDTLEKYLRKKYSRAYWRACVYKRFPGKAVRDSYTPQSLKLQILLAWSTVALLAGSLVVPGAAIPLAISGALLLATMVPFVVGTFRSDPLIALVAPGILFLRGLVMGAGLMAAIPRLMRVDPLSPAAS